MLAKLYLLFKKKELWVLIFAAALYMPCNGDILVYKVTCNFDPWIDFNDADCNVAAAVGAKQIAGYLVLDVNITEWELNADPIVIFYGGTGEGKWGMFFDVNDANGSVDFEVFDIEGKEYDGLLLDIWWDNEQEKVGTLSSTLYGKTGKVDIGKGAKNKAEIPGSLKGIVETQAEVNDFFEAFGNITATVNSKYTQNANKAEEPNQDDIVGDIILDLDKQGYNFDRLPWNVCTLTVDINGPGTVKPNYDNQLLKVGRTYSMTAKPGNGVKFIDWTGSISSPNLTLIFEMASDLAFKAKFLDVQKPTVTVISPASGQWLSNAVVTITGKAKDNVAVAGVYYRLNNSGLWHIAEGTTSWKSAKLILKPGTNTISTSAADTSGNISAPSDLSFVCQTAIQIASLDTNNAPPFSFLKININPTAGFNPTKAFVVRFFDSAGFEVDVTPVQVDPNFIIVSVPPYLNLQTNEVQEAVVNLQVTQTSAPSNVVSGVVSGFTIQDLPSPSFAPGLITQSYLQGSLNQAIFLKWAIGGTLFDTSAMNTALSDYISDVNNLLDRIQEVVQTPSTAFSLGSLGGNPIVVDITTLQNMDRLIVGFVQAQASDTSSPTPCGASEAEDLADAMLGSDDNAMRAAIASYNSALTDCVPDSFNPSYNVVGGALGIGIGLALMAGTPTEANALPTAALLYVTVEEAGGIIAVGGAWGQGNAISAQLVQNNVNRINNILLSPLRELLAESQGDLLTLGQDAKSIYDAFAAVPLLTYALSIGTAGTGSGIVTANPPPNAPGGTYVNETIVTLTAAPDAGSTFAGWSGDAAGTAKSINIRMNGNKSVTATFNKTPQTWHIVAGGQTATLTVDDSGNFTGSGWFKSTVGCILHPNITNGKMSGTNVTFSVSKSDSDSGYVCCIVTGSGTGTLNASFPSATTASGNVTIQVENACSHRNTADTVKWVALRQ
jgi:uncharacterized repeat protein (TIGR02543 family)